MLHDSETYNSGPGQCNDDCPFGVNVGVSVGFSQEYVARGDNFVITSESNDVILHNGSATQFRSGGYILLRTGFEVRSGARFEALLKACNEQN